MRELITNRADLYVIARYAHTEDVKTVCTPLLNFLLGLVQGSTNFHKQLHLWLDDLEASGVDLLEYGRKEKELHKQMKIPKIMSAIIANVG